MESENKKVVWALHAIMLVGNIVAIAAIVLVAWFVHYMGPDFALGGLFTITIYQVSHRIVYGKWIDF